MRERLLEKISEAKGELQRIRDQSSSLPTERQWATILLMLLTGLTQRGVARALQHARSTVTSTVRRFREGGVEAMQDGRRDKNRLAKREEILDLLPRLTAKQPDDFGWKRTMWSVELVSVEVLRHLGVKVSRSHMGRLLKEAGCRRMRPKPVVSKAPEDKEKQIAALRGELAELPSSDVVLYSDEVDIHLNPKVGPDWAPAGMRKQVVTPGQNKKWYMAGAYNPESRNLIVVDGQRKNSALFIALLHELVRRYRGAGTIHLVVDNYVIHRSKITQKALAKLNGKVVLHFLPPYCPDYNPIERVWLDLHSSVTRNHRCEGIEQLVGNCKTFVAGYARKGTKGTDRLRCAA
jgi:transposase